MQILIQQPTLEISVLSDLIFYLISRQREVKGVVSSLSYFGSLVEIQLWPNISILMGGCWLHVRLHLTLLNQCYVQ